MARKSSKPKSKPTRPKDVTKEFATPEGIKNIIKNFNVKKGND